MLKDQLMSLFFEKSEISINREERIYIFNLTYEHKSNLIPKKQKPLLTESI